MNCKLCEITERKRRNRFKKYYLPIWWKIKGLRLPRPFIKKLKAKLKVRYIYHWWREKDELYGRLTRIENSLKFQKKAFEANTKVLKALLKTETKV